MHVCLQGAKEQKMQIDVVSNNLFRKQELLREKQNKNQNRSDVGVGVRLHC